MNAYELADAIEDWETGANYTISIKAGQMLRQQAKRIEELEDKLSFYALKDSWIDKEKLQKALDADRDRAMDELVKWQQEFDNKSTSYAKLKEDFE